jgi:hypothetical protein
MLCLAQSIGAIMTSDDFETMAKLVKTANTKFDGHLSVLKFTTNWRISFVTPDGRDGIEEMYVGETFDEAATKALLGAEDA